MAIDWLHCIWEKSVAGIATDPVPNQQGAIAPPPTKERKMARSFKIFGIKDGGSEEWVDTVSSPKAGKAAHEAMKTEGHYDHIRCRDCLGGLRFEYNLKTGRKTA